MEPFGDDPQEWRWGYLDREVARAPAPALTPTVAPMADAAPVVHENVFTDAAGAAAAAPTGGAPVNNWAMSLLRGSGGMAALAALAPPTEAELQQQVPSIVAELRPAMDRLLAMLVLLPPTPDVLFKLKLHVPITEELAKTLLHDSCLRGVEAKVVEWLLDELKQHGTARAGDLQCRLKTKRNYALLGESSAFSLAFCCTVERLSDDKRRRLALKDAKRRVDDLDFRAQTLVRQAELQAGAPGVGRYVHFGRFGDSAIDPQSEALMEKIEAAADPKAAADALLTPLERALEEGGRAVAVARVEEFKAKRARVLEQPTV